MSQILTNIACQVEDLLNNLQNEPVVLVLVAVLAVAIAFLFMIPVFINYLKSFGLTKIKADDEVKEVEEPEGEAEKPEKPRKEEKVEASEVKKPSKKLPKFSFNLNLKKKSPKTIVLTIIALVIVVGVGYFAYDFFFRPVRIVNAWQIRLERASGINQLQEKGGSAWTSAKVHLLDIRSGESYAEEHIIGSSSLPANRAKTEIYPIDGVALVIYSSEFSFDSAKEVAEAILKNGDSGRISYKNQGKIYIIKDGFEGLKKSGLKTEEGAYD